MNKTEIYKALVEKLNAELKENFGFPFTSVNGNMYSFLGKEGVMGIRLPEADRQQFLEQFNSEIYATPNGQIKKEYVVIPDTLMADEQSLLLWFEKSLAFAQSLKPKKQK